MSEIVIYDSSDRYRQLLKQVIPPTLVSSRPTTKSAYIKGEIEDNFADAEEWLFTFPDEDLWQLERVLNMARQNLEEHMANRLEELEIPEVFDLPALSSKRVTAKVRKIEPAQFYFVMDKDINWEDIDED